MKKRPLFAMAIGFVLGEVCALQAESGKNIRWIFLLGTLIFCALVFCVSIFRALVCRVTVCRAMVFRAQALRFFACRSVHNRLWILLLLCVFWAGYGRMAWEIRGWERIERRIWDDGEVVYISGKITEIRKKEKNTALTIKTRDFGKVLVYVEREEKDAEDGNQAADIEKLPIGGKVHIQGEVSRFREAKNPGEFDFKNYYASLGISASVSAWDVVWEEEESYSPYLDALYRFRCFCSRIFEEICEPEDAGIFRAAILGEKDGMAEEIRDLYQKNGISHLLAISGLHLSLLGAGLHKFLRKCGLGYGISGWAAALFICSYGILTGASGSAMRAVIMLAVSFLAAYGGRTYDLLSALSLAALLLSASRPFSITQSGFQLSFGAVLGIGLLGKALEDGGKIKKGWMQGIVMSAAVQLATAPVVLWHYFQIPVYGVLLNLAVVPLMGYVIVSGLLGLFMGAICPGAGVMAVGTGHYILQFYQRLCEITSRLPGYILIWGRPKTFQILLYYLLLGGMVIGLRAAGAKEKEEEEETEKEDGEETERGNGEERGRKGRKKSERKDREERGRKDRKKSERKDGIKKGKWFLPWGVVLAGTLLCVLSLKPRPQQGMDIAVLDVGQGDGIVLQCEGGIIKTQGIVWAGRGAQEKKHKKKQQAVILMDGGSTSEKRLGEKRLEPYLKSQGISRIDFAIVSHGDEDHISGLFYLLKECPEIAIGCLILPEAGMGDEGYKKLLDAAQKRDICVGYMDAGDKIWAGACCLTCFYPGKEMVIDFSDRNQQSLVIRADYQDFHMLFTGDVGQEGEKMALEYAGEKEFSIIQVLKAAHHGSRFSSGEAFLAAIHPAWTVISYGENNSYGHPHEETLKRLEEEESMVLETGKMGAVLLHVEKGKVWYRCYAHRSAQ